MYKIKRIIEKFDQFNDLDEKVILAIAQNSILRHYHQGEIIFFDGDEVDYLYIVVEGKVKISKFTSSGKEKIIHILEEGDIINEISLDRRKSSITAEMLEAGELILINITSLLRIMEENFVLTLQLFNSLSLKLRQSYRQLRNLGLKKTGPRVASRLWKLARDYGEKNRQGIKIDLNLSQRELALMIGASRETVSRFLKELEREEVIKVGNTQITILDIERLREWT
ncbi:CRP-like cAMP-binding protein [Orenia metallireducens]|uniref:cAMP-binding domain of CRP or a regulatory subunit of cAMP-dependent protein kinases n=1 Tax=Orenia metallireducens TaxID=1413210 RepID=A0A285IF19_9FIRM|nr:Crp/Fnr family transcriptional regulator [Orenia metallireducens]PRX28038.1 CRP-like cAMP-binding protein [Orenia metallireducens]SNY45541.1 cAMP-binding domain of CRP or a regulatory subunit of cAMP-dependent protein kinases [Orenia metallireducens]